MGYLFGFHELCGLGLGILFTLERMFGDRATKQPKYCHFICPFVVPSNIVLVATWLLLYGRHINSLSSQIVLEVDEVCQQF